MRPVHLAGYDGTPSSRAAVDLAVALGRPFDARVICVTGYDVPFPTLGKGASIAADAMLAEAARHGASTVAAEVHAPGVERVTQPGSGSAALCLVAERENADLIAVGVSDRGALGRIVPGSTAEQLIHGAPCAIAVAPETFRDGPLETIAVAYDRGAEAQVAVQHACELALAHGARLRVIAACTTPVPTMEFPSPEAGGEFRDHLRADVDDLVGELPPELHATGEVLSGWAGRVLVEACRTGVDLLVAGSRSYGPLRGALVGSTSRFLVEHATCPVLVVPRTVTSSASRADAAVAAS